MVPFSSVTITVFGESRKFKVNLLTLSCHVTPYTPPNQPKYEVWGKEGRQPSLAVTTENGVRKIMGTPRFIGSSWREWGWLGRGEGVSIGK